MFAFPPVRFKRVILTLEANQSEAKPEIRQMCIMLYAKNQMSGTDGFKYIILRA